MTDVETIFQDFERVFEARRRAEDWTDERAKERHDAEFLRWLEASIRITADEYRAALAEYDRRRAPASIDAEAVERERILRDEGVDTTKRRPRF